MSRHKLIKYHAPYDEIGSSEVFLDAMREAIAYHDKNNSFFARLLKKYNFRYDNIQTEADIADIPLIPANFFKYYECLSLPMSEIVEYATSSGTGGQKSQMFFDRDSWDFGQDMIKSLFSYFELISEEPTNYLLFTYEPTAGSTLGTAKTDQGLMQYAPQNDVFYALRYNGLSHDFDVYGTIDALKEYEKQGKPVRIFGFPSFLHFTLNQMQRLNMRPLALPPSSMTLFGGGWKGHADKQVPKTTLYRQIEEMLRIPSPSCRDAYGSTEHSVPYIECENHNFHVPIYSRMIIRDVKTLQPLPFGNAGFANFITPHLLSVPAISVLMGDLAVMRKGGACGCGIQAPTMEILGRAGTSAAKSCAVTASELLRR